MEKIFQCQEEEVEPEDPEYDGYSSEYQEDSELETHYSYHYATSTIQEDFQSHFSVDAMESLYTITGDDRDDTISRAPTRIKNSSPLKWVVVYQLANPSNLASFKCLYDKGSTRSLLDATVANKIGKNIRLLENQSAKRG